MKNCRRILGILALAILAATLLSCGNRGPLYLPDQSESLAPEQSVPDEDEEGDGLTDSRAG